jgi:hypothetical protein
MNYSRAHPSPRYLELLKLYRAMHEQGEIFLGVPAEKTFPGTSLPLQARRIRPLISSTGAQTILDYGSGKGKQYEPQMVLDEGGRQCPSVMDYWGIEEVVCYDPCYEPFIRLPEGKFDGVISTDVLEHCPEEDISWILGEMFAYAEKFVFANVACYPARKRLPNGENAHCTIRPPEWWKQLLDEIAARHPTVKWEVWVSHKPDGSQKIVDYKLGNT